MIILLFKINKSVSIFFIISLILTIFLSILNIKLLMSVLIPVVCLLYLVSKYRSLLKFNITLYGDVYINPSESNFTKDDLSVELNKTISLYEDFMSADDVMRNNIIFIEFVENSFNSFGVLVNGICSGNYIKVSYWKDRPLIATALSHEIGHFLLGKYLGTNDESVHHKFMKKNNLP